jgi:predicted RNase H-like HicB family nuclease
MFRFAGAPERIVLWQVTADFAVAGGDTRAFCIDEKRKGLLEEGLFEDYKLVLDRQEDGSWVAEIPAISGCYALMPTRESALAELAGLFRLIADEYRERWNHTEGRAVTIPIHVGRKSQKTQP